MWWCQDPRNPHQTDRERPKKRKTPRRLNPRSAFFTVSVATALKTVPRRRYSAPGPPPPPPPPPPTHPTHHHTIPQPSPNPPAPPPPPGPTIQKPSIKRWIPHFSTGTALDCPPPSSLVFLIRIPRSPQIPPKFPYLGVSSGLCLLLSAELHVHTVQYIHKQFILARTLKIRKIRYQLQDPHHPIHPSSCSVALLRC